MKTKIISVHYLRVIARIRERELQHLLDRHETNLQVNGVSVPDWARGARVEKAGRFQWSVLATEARGH